MVRDPGKLLCDLAQLATSPNEAEAAAAALKACEIIRSQPGVVRIHAQAGVHPLAALFRRLNMRPGQAARSGWCISCGEPIDLQDPIVEHPDLGTTHMACREWWGSVDLAAARPLSDSAEDDEIPF